jgi:biotin carboxyl carrier protein
MTYEVEVGGRVRRVVVARSGASFAVTVDGRTRQVDATRIDAHTLSLIVDGVWPKDVVVTPGPGAGRFTATIDGVPVAVSLNGTRGRGKGEARAGAGGSGRVSAPMPGKIVRVLVAAGDTVRAGQPLAVIEAMKMENELRAGRGGTVAEVLARQGDSVDTGALLVVIQ